MVLILILLLILIFYLYFGREDDIIINLSGTGKGAFSMKLRKNSYSKEEFKKKLQKLLMCVFGKWSTNFEFECEGSKSYCAGVLASIFNNKPQFKVIAIENTDFKRGLEQNIDKHQYLGFECVNPIEIYLKTGCVTGLLNFNYHHANAFSYLAKFTGECEISDKKYCVKVFGKVKCYEFISKHKFREDKFTCSDEKISIASDFMNFILNDECSDLINSNCKLLSETAIPGESKKKFLFSYLYGFLPMWGCKKMNDFTFHAEVLGLTNMVLYINSFFTSRIEICETLGAITYNSKTDPNLENKGYNTKLRILFNRMLIGKDIVLKTSSLNPISDHILTTKVNTKREKDFQELLNKEEYDKKPIRERDLGIYKRIYPTKKTWYSHEKNFKDIKWNDSAEPF